MNKTNLPKTVTILTLTTIFVILICLTTVTAQPELFLITGEVLKPDGSPYNGPCVHVTNRNTAESWNATINSTSIYTPVVRGTFNLTITIDPENKIGQLNHNLTIHDLILEIEIKIKEEIRLKKNYWKISATRGRYTNTRMTDVINE